MVAIWLVTMLISPWAFSHCARIRRVVAGSADFSRSGSTLQITTSDKVIINWGDFSIGSGEITRFLQPSSTSSALNRVISGNPSSILGSLQANGQIYLINPNGILVGGGADQLCLFITLHYVNNADFMAGGNLNFVGSSTAGIQNLVRSMPLAAMCF